VFTVMLSIVAVGTLYPIILTIRAVHRNSKYLMLYALAVNDMISLTLSFTSLHLMLDNGSLSVLAVLIAMTVLSTALSLGSIKKKLILAENLARDLIAEQLDVNPPEPGVQVLDPPANAQNAKEDSAREKYNILTPIFMVT
jgi:hypothetical protein